MVESMGGRRYASTLSELIGFRGQDELTKLDFFLSVSRSGFRSHSRQRGHFDKAKIKIYLASDEIVKQYSDRQMKLALVQSSHFPTSEPTGSCSRRLSFNSRQNPTRELPIRITCSKHSLSEPIAAHVAPSHEISLRKNGSSSSSQAPEGLASISIGVPILRLC